MNVTIDENRIITITPETPAEALALRYWSDGYKPKATGIDGDISLSSLVVISAVQPKEAMDGWMQKADEA